MQRKRSRCQRIAERREAHIGLRQRNTPRRRRGCPRGNVPPSHAPWRRREVVLPRVDYCQRPERGSPGYGRSIRIWASRRESWISSRRRDIRRRRVKVETVRRASTPNPIPLMEKTTGSHRSRMVDAHPQQLSWSRRARGLGGQSMRAVKTVTSCDPMSGIMGPWTRCPPRPGRAKRVSSCRSALAIGGYCSTISRRGAADATSP